MGRRSTSRAAGMNETEENNIQMMMLDRDDSVPHQLNTSINRRTNANKESYIDEIANNEQSVI